MAYSNSNYPPFRPSGSDEWPPPGMISPRSAKLTRRSSSLKDSHDEKVGTLSINKDEKVSSPHPVHSLVTPERVVVGGVPSSSFSPHPPSSLPSSPSPSVSLAVAKIHAIIAYLHRSTLLQHGWDHSSHQTSPVRTERMSMDDPLIDEVDALLQAMGGDVEETLLGLVDLESSRSSMLPVATVQELIPILLSNRRTLAIHPNSRSPPIPSLARSRSESSTTTTTGGVTSDRRTPSSVHQTATSPVLVFKASPRSRTTLPPSSPQAASPSASSSSSASSHSSPAKVQPAGVGVSDPISILLPPSAIPQSSRPTHRFVSIEHVDHTPPHHHPPPPHHHPHHHRHQSTLPRPSRMLTPDGMMMTMMPHNRCKSDGLPALLPSPTRRRTAHTISFQMEQFSSPTKQQHVRVVSSAASFTSPSSPSHPPNTSVSASSSPTPPLPSPHPPLESITTLLCTLLQHPDSTTLKLHVTPNMFESLREQSGCATGVGGTISDLIYMTDSNHPPPIPTPHRRTVSAIPFSKDAPLQVYLRQLVFEHRSFTTTSTSSSFTTHPVVNPFDTLCLEVRRRHFESFEIKRLLVEFLQQYQCKLGLKEVYRSNQHGGGNGGGGGGGGVPPSSSFTLKDAHHLYVGSGAGKYVMRVLEGMLLRASRSSLAVAVSSSRTDGLIPSSPSKRHTSFDSFVHDLLPHMRLWEMTRARCIDLIYQLVRSSEIVARKFLPELTYIDEADDVNQQYHSRNVNANSNTNHTRVWTKNDIVQLMEFIVARRYRAKTTATTTTTSDIDVESTGSISTNTNPASTATFSCSSLPSCLILQILLEPSSSSSSSSYPQFESLHELKLWFLERLSQIERLSLKQLKEEMVQVLRRSLKGYNNMDDDEASSLDASTDAFLHNLYTSDRLDPASMLILWRLSPWSIHVVDSDTDDTNVDDDAEFTFDKFRAWLLVKFDEYFFSPNGVERLLIHTTLLASFPSNTSSRRIVSSPGIVERMLEILPPDTHKRVPRILELITSLNHRTFTSVDTFLNTMRSRYHAFEHERQSLMTLLRTIPSVNNNNDDDNSISHEKVLEGLLNLFPTSIRIGALNRYRNGANGERMRMSSPLRLCILDMRRALGDESPHASFASATPPPSSSSLLSFASRWLHSTWRPTIRIVHLFLMALPISSLASHLAPRTLLHPDIILTEEQIEQVFLLIVSNHPPSTPSASVSSSSPVSSPSLGPVWLFDAWRTLLTMRSDKELPEAETWQGFLTAMHLTRMKLETSDISQQDLSPDSTPIEYGMLLCYLHSRSCRLLPPSVSSSLTPSKLHLRHTTLSLPSPSIPFDHLFHLILQLDTLEFQIEYLCTTLEELFDVLVKAYEESAAKRLSILNMWLSSQLFQHHHQHTNNAVTHAANSPAAAGVTSTTTAATAAFVPTGMHVYRFSCYIGSGTMTPRIFRALGLERPLPPDDDDGGDGGDDGRHVFMRFIRHARCKAGQRDMRTKADTVAEEEYDDEDEHAYHPAACAVSVNPPLPPPVFSSDPLPSPSSLTVDDVFTYLSSPTCPLWSIPVLVTWNDMDRLLGLVHQRSHIRLWKKIQELIQNMTIDEKRNQQQQPSSAAAGSPPATSTPSLKKFDHVDRLYHALLKRNHRTNSNTMVHVDEQTRHASMSVPEDITLPPIR